ncbi:MAG: NrdH-redoxin [Patescibacteria group bacterium]
MKIELFGKVVEDPDNDPCRTTREHLMLHGLDFTFVDVNADPTAKQRIKDLDSNYSRAPIVLVTHEDGKLEHWTGFFPPRIDALAAQKQAA